MTLVLCRGVFDLLHVAHIRHLQEARSMGDYLVVSLNTDENATKEKRKPITQEKERREILLALKCVSAVDICADYLESFRKWKPDIYCKGHDHLDKLLDREFNYCSMNNILIRFTKPNPQTTSGIIERIKCAS